MILSDTLQYFGGTHGAVSFGSDTEGKDCFIRAPFNRDTRK